jgi:hypothetical protein
VVVDVGDHGPAVRDKSGRNFAADPLAGTGDDCGSKLTRH